MVSRTVASRLAPVIPVVTSTSRSRTLADNFAVRASQGSEEASTVGFVLSLGLAILIVSGGLGGKLAFR